MSGKVFRSHGCMDYVEKKKLTGLWEIQGRSGSMHVLSGHEYWSGEATSTCYGSNYTFDLRWYPEDPLSSENRTQVQALLDAMPEPIKWSDYYRMGGKDVSCEKGDWPDRPKGVNGWSPKDIETCYHFERDWFLDSTQDMRLVPYPESVHYATNPTKLVPIRVKPSSRLREAKAENEKQKKARAKYEKKRAADEKTWKKRRKAKGQMKSQRKSRRCSTA